MKPEGVNIIFGFKTQQLHDGEGEAPFLSRLWLYFIEAILHNENLIFALIVAISTILSFTANSAILFVILFYCTPLVSL